MIPSYPPIPHSIAQFLLSIILSLASATLYAMGGDIEQNVSTELYKPAKWSINSDAESDAQRAIDHKDYQLLAFALRVTNVPGIDHAEVEAYRISCGIRFMKGFGDTVRSNDELERMKLAREYALRYNSVIKSQCTPN